MMTGDPTPPQIAVPYPGFLDELIARFNERLRGIKVEYNFEYGAEFEIAICSVLRDVLPSWVGVCRGYIVGEDGSKAGDDIILFDAGHFPTLRLLGKELALKERVPVDAVLAYVEAKHTLYLAGNDGASLAKALEQVKAVKRIVRRAVSPHQLARGIELGDGFHLTAEPGWPSIRNPMLCAIWAPHVDCGGQPESPQALLKRIIELKGSPADVDSPDIIAAGRLLASPAFRRTITESAARPFLSSTCELSGSRHDAQTLALAVFYLLWGIEWLQLGSMPWGRMLSAELIRAGIVVANPSDQKVP